jgi:transcription initiation factor TFIIE subunit alpha
MLSNPIVVDYLNDIVEEEANLGVVKCLINNKNTDEEIAEETGIRLNIVRKILYKLYDSGLASYKRSKDPETQWFTYSWRFDSNNIAMQIAEEYEAKISTLKEKLEFEEQNMFFSCDYGHERFDYSQASELDFVCPHCGNKISFADNEEIISNIKNEIKQHEKAFKKIKSQ